MYVDKGRVLINHIITTAVLVLKECVMCHAVCMQGAAAVGQAAGAHGPHAAAVG
jgi:hypothetical protein